MASLKDISPLIRKIAYRQNLTVDEAREALNTIGKEDIVKNQEISDGFYFLAFTMGLMAKGPTVDELYGCVQSISDNSVRFVSDLDPDNIIDISGTGGDKIKTFNVGTTASFVVAAGGVNVAKQSTRGYTGLTGSADIFKEIGLDPFTINQEKVMQLLNEANICAFYTPAFTPGFKSRIDFLTKIKNIGLSYPTPWHLVSWVYSPFKMSARIYGVFDKQYFRVLAELFQKLGYQRVLVVNGVDGLDEISVVGETIIVEVDGEEIKEYSITPEQFGLKRAAPADIQTLTDEELSLLATQDTDPSRKVEIEKAGRHRNISTFFEILYNKMKGPKRHLVLLNAAAAFYLCKKVANLEEGVSLARQIIESGQAKERLEKFADLADGGESLKEWKKNLSL